MRIVSIGEILWDVFPDTEHLGGASFNFAAHAARLGHEVEFISAVGADERGRLALELARRLGVSTRYVRVLDDEPTGFVSVALDAAGQPSFVIHRPVAYDFTALGVEDLAELAAAPPDWIYYGTLFQMSPPARAATQALLDAAPRSRRFYDINLRQDSYTPALVLDLLRLATVVKLNEAEVREVERMMGEQPRSLEAFCVFAAQRFGCEGVCVTRDVRGCALWLAGNYVESPGYQVRVADAVGAGDAFAAALLHGLGSGWPAGRIAGFANRVGALIASRPGAIPEWNVGEVQSAVVSYAPCEECQ